MNIVFGDKLSQQAWHATRRFNEAHREQLDHWLSTFLNGAWCDHQLPESHDQLARPDWQRQTGHMGQLLIHAPWNDLEVIEGKLLAHEFAWSVSAVPVDAYGRPDPSLAKTVIFGGLIDHSRDPDEPRWSSHT
jgi:hypothetical protein